MGRWRFEMTALQWSDGIDRARRRDLDAAFRRYGVSWSSVANDEAETVTHRSSPLDVAVARKVRDEAKRLGLDLTAHAVHTHAHIARVKVGRSFLAVGLGAPMADAADALSRGVPIAVIDGERVTPYSAALYGHTDAELLAAPLLTRAQHADAGGAR